MSQAKFIAASNIPATLIRAVVKQTGGWSLFKEQSEGMSHSIDDGYGGWIYHHETVPFFTRNRRSIIELAKQQAEDFGQGMLEMVAGFNSLNGEYTVDEIGETLFGGEPDTQIANTLAWYAAEEVARAYRDFIENV